MPIAGGITLLVVGAILTFALTDGSVQGLDLRVVGAILMLAGACAILLPLLVRGRRPRSNWPAARSRQDAIDDGEISEVRRSWTRKVRREKR